MIFDKIKSYLKKKRKIVKDPIPTEVLIDLYNEGIISKEEFEEASGLLLEDFIDD